MIRQIFASKK
jgi:hypothetical protein